MLNHQQLQELLGVYALDAVDGAERAEIEDHLQVCATCLAETAGHVRVALALAHDANGGTMQARKPPAVPRRRRARVLVAAVAVAVVVAGVVSAGVGQQRRLHRVEMATDHLITTAGRAELAARAQLTVSDPLAQRVALADGAGRQVATAVVEPNGTAYLFAGGLAALDADHSYELWRIEDNRRVPAGTLASGSPVLAFRVTAATVIVTVTIEAAGGAATSDHPPVAQGTVALIRA